ncbi:sodium:solute symporter [Pseudogracilibacillus auburnensis]|uniref:SSS family solute:Na+ symporter n=1 Tax=Pseudogracilibacillus auburnensis TaxID=1494959 RepID=A0A2V3W5I6_9BACI|nr:sodium:solute symporter family protein [Pseudogracilibacillus auburnensis]MBO1001704.1 sodium:solute symporter family protein [Pseudogracilibacillus auburnensis]PXW89372.1 SSS family solute:Na+ symporter [Pseudogracilibacillus auburnensis]
MAFNTVFLIMFIAFLLLLLAGGFITKKWVSNSNDFFIAGREVGLLVNIFGVAAIGFAGTIITLGPGLAIMTGFWGAVGFGIIYGFGGLALYGIVFAPYIRRSGAHTLSEWLEMRFDSRTRTLVTLATILGLLGIMANNVVSMAIVTTGFTGWSLLGTLAVIFFLFLLFTYIGGFWAVTLTDFMQMCVGLIALPVMLIALLMKYGGSSFLLNNWSGNKGFFTAGIADQSLPIFSLQYPSVLTFTILFGCFLVWGNNYYWLRVSSARNEKVARNGFIYGAMLLVFVPITILAIVGVYAASIFPDHFAPHGDTDPMSAFGVVLKALPIGVAALALIGALAASISTSTTALIGASSTAVRDLYQRFLHPNATSEQLTMPSKIITLILGILVWLLSFYPGGPLYLFAFSTAWLGAPSILVFLGVWWKRTTKAGAFYGAVLGMSITALLTVLELTGIFVISNYTHIGVVGLVFTLVTTIVISLLSEPNYYSRPNWKEKAPSFSSLTGDEIKALNLIAEGYHTMAEVTDMFGTDSSKTNEIIESLDQKLLLTREKYSGPGFYSFTLTDEGYRHVTIDISKGSTDYYMNKEEKVILRKLKEGPDVLNQYLQAEKFDSLRLSVLLAKLIEQGYLKEEGIWRRSVALTAKGKEALLGEMDNDEIYHILDR